MTELYGTAFMTAYGDTPSPLWQAAIGELTDDQCRSGLTRLVKEAREYPANLPQFIAACTYKEPVRYLGVPLDAEGWKRLSGAPPEQRASREKIDGYLAKMRAKLGPVVEDARCFGRSTFRGHAPCTCQAQGTCQTCLYFARLMNEADENRGKGKSHGDERPVTESTVEAEQRSAPSDQQRREENEICERANP